MTIKWKTLDLIKAYFFSNTYSSIFRFALGLGFVWGYV